MNSIRRPLQAIALLSGLACAAHAGTVNVSFVEPSRFSDAGDSQWHEKANLEAIARHLQALGQQRLPAGHVLKVEVLDVDLAGTLRSSVMGSELRVLRGGADWPKISLRYTLEVDGKPAQSGEERLSDMNYSRGMSGFRDSKPLFYEKRMLDAWFRARFAPASAG